jgi:hypothetical protein
VLRFVSTKLEHFEMMDRQSYHQDEALDEMARKAGVKRIPADELKVAPYDARLKGAKLDRSAFESVYADILADDDLSVTDIIEIALRYRGGGSKPPSRKAALEIISKRFLELVRSKAQIAQAQKARPW